MVVCTLSACSGSPLSESSETEQEWTVSISDAENANDSSSAETEQASSSAQPEPESNTAQTQDDTNQDAVTKDDTDVVIVDVEEVSSEAMPEDGTVLVRVNQDANVRDAPSSSNSNVVTTVAAGTELYAVSSDEYWTCVIIDGGYYYIYTPFLDIVSGSFSD